MSDIPKAMELMEQLIATNPPYKNQLWQIYLLLPRKKAASRAPQTSAKMTKDIGDLVRATKKLNPTWGVQQIAGHVSKTVGKPVNPGRVSEALNGQWV